ncbi:MAG: hypothetical protein ACYDBH_06445 [Acidobacteriaceae bacterium]
MLKPMDKTFDPVVRNAEKESARQRDAALLASGQASAQEITQRNAFVPYSIDLSRWVRLPSREPGDDDGWLP